MAVTTGTTFISLMSGMLNRANMSGLALAYYSFRTPVGQTELAFNDLLPTGSIYLWPDTSRYYADSFPAFSVGNTDNIISSMQNGSGYFIKGNNDFLRVGNLLHSDDWTLLLNFTPSGAKNTGVSNILVSTMDSVNQKSGMLFGINDANRLFIEYLDTTDATFAQRRIFVQPPELSENNIVSISNDSTHNTITICNHNIAKQTSYERTYITPGYVPTRNLYIGGFTNSTNHTSYTGYYGIMQDALLLSGAANPSQLNALAPLFCLTGYAPQSTTGVVYYFSVVTGASFINTAIFSGVTGYNTGQVDLPDKDGSTIPVWDMLSQTGVMSGTGVVYLTGVTQGSGIIYSGVDEVLNYDNTYVKQYADSFFVMLRYPILTGDWIEVYSFDVKWPNKISVLPDAFNLYDFYLSNDFDSDNANVYYNGLLQVTGIDYVINSGKIMSAGYGTYKSSYDYLLYDEISGQTTVQSFTGYSGATLIDAISDLGWQSKMASGAGVDDYSAELLFGNGSDLTGYQWNDASLVNVGQTYRVVGGSASSPNVVNPSGITIDFGVIDDTPTYWNIGRLYTLPSGTTTITPTTGYFANTVHNGYAAFRFIAGDASSAVQYLAISVSEVPPALDGQHDVYLNGQKLISGVDFNLTSTAFWLTGDINGVTPMWASGYFVYPPIRTGDGADRFCGTGIGYYHDFTNTLGRLLDEMVYVNGQRLAPGIDYVTTSSGSLLNTDFRPGGWEQFWVYTGDSFGTGVVALVPNLDASSDDTPVSPTAPSPL